MTRARQHLIGEVRDALEAYPLAHCPPTPTPTPTLARRPSMPRPCSASMRWRRHAMWHCRRVCRLRGYGASVAPIPSSCRTDGARTLHHELPVARSSVNTGAPVIGDSNRVRHPYTAGLPHGAFHDT
ncbi:hypothetical protein LLE60_11840 [Xanthomonas campestris]|nr:hypothetical protein [Xanthomonas campestris]